MPPGRADYGSSVVPRLREVLLETGVVLNAAWSAHCLRQEFRAKFSDLRVALRSAPEDGEGFR